MIGGVAFAGGRSLSFYPTASLSSCFTQPSFSLPGSKGWNGGSDSDNKINNFVQEIYNQENYLCGDERVRLLNRT